MEIGNNGLDKTFTINNLGKGKYYFEVQAIDNAFNGSAYSETIEICNSQEIDLPDTVFKCQNEEYLTSISESFKNIIWNTGETDYNISISDEGLYKVEALDVYGCLSRDSILVLNIALPTIDLGEDVFSCEPPSVVLDATFPNSEYRWMNNSLNSTLEVTDFGIYWIEVRNSCGVSTDTIKFSTPGKISFIPNVFTPNNDGMNDFFEIKSNHKNLHLQVFNRSGNLIYESRTYSNDWDGGDLAPGIYYYCIKDNCGESYKGFVKILR